MQLKAVEEISELLSQLPGIGPKTAEKIAFSIVKKGFDYADKLARAVEEVKNLKHCSTCGIITDRDPCEICSDPTRDHSVICVVEESEDVFALERTGEFNGVYHVLGGSISAVRGIAPSDLRIKELIERVRSGNVSEIILATNPTTEGEATALLIAKEIENTGIKITRIALGIPSGANVSHADEFTLSKAIRRREKFEID